LLNSLFADRLDFLQRALEELQGAQREREKLAQDALEELDSDILECERSLAALLDPDRKEQLRRRLLGLKGERRREKLLTWRDIVWLRGEIRKLQRDAEAFGRTAKSAENRDAPR
jgi:hypothetical protein